MYYFIVNPNAKSGKGRIIWQKVCHLMNSKGLAYEVLFTEKKDRLQNLHEKRRNEAISRFRAKEQIWTVPKRSSWLWAATERSQKSWMAFGTIRR